MAHGLDGYSLDAASSEWRLFELAMSPAYAGNVIIAVEGEWHVIRSDGLADRESGYFPNPGNLNRITA